MSMKGALAFLTATLVLLAAALSSQPHASTAPKANPPTRFVAIVADIVGPHQQVFLVADLKHPDQCLLIIEAIAVPPASAAVALTSTPWSCQ